MREDASVATTNVLLAGGEDTLLDELRKELVARGIAVERMGFEAATAGALPDVVVCDPTAPGAGPLLEKVGKETGGRPVLVLVAEGDVKLPDTTRGRAAILARSVGAQTIASRVEVLAGTLARTSQPPAAPAAITDDRKPSTLP